MIYYDPSNLIFNLQCRSAVHQHCDRLVQFVKGKELGLRNEPPLGHRCARMVHVFNTPAFEECSTSLAVMSRKSRYPVGVKKGEELGSNSDFSFVTFRGDATDACVIQVV